MERQLEAYDAGQDHLRRLSFLGVPSDVPQPPGASPRPTGHLSAPERAKSAGHLRSLGGRHPWFLAPRWLQRIAIDNRLLATGFTGSCTPASCSDVPARLSPKLSSRRRRRDISPAPYRASAARHTFLRRRGLLFAGSQDRSCCCWLPARTPPQLPDTAAGRA